MTQRRVTSGAVDIAVLEDGSPEDPTVLLVHGYPDTGAVWDEVVERLRHRFHVVTYDVRGAGESSVPRDPRAYALPELVRDLAAVIDAVSPARPVHLVGHDWGSIQGWEAVTGALLDGRIASFTSISGPCLDHVGHWMRSRVRPARRTWPRDWAELAGQGARSWYVGFFQAPGLPEALWRRVLARRWSAFLSQAEGVEPRPGHPADTLGRDAAAGVALYRTNVPSRLREPAERRTDVPVQLVVPDRDTYLSPALYAGLEQWAPRLWRRTLRAGHWVQRTHPETLARWITEFAEHLDRADGARHADSLNAVPASRSLRRSRSGGTNMAFGDHLVVVTGAGGGIGRATTLAFAEAGAEVVAADVDGSAAARTVEAARERGPGAYAYTVDVSDSAAMERFAAGLREDHGVPDVVVNNAGIAVAGSFLDTSVRDWEQVIGVNLWGVIHGARVFGAQLAERGEGGHIVNVASAAGYLPSRSLPAYSATKSAVLMLSQCLRAELAGAGIGVTAICPGFVNTGISRAARFVGVSDGEQERLRAVTARAFGRRNLAPERVAAQILRAVRDDTPVVPVGVEAKVGLALSRISPSALRALARAARWVPGDRTSGSPSTIE